MTKLIQVIYTEVRRGDGTEKNLSRMVPQLWTTDGKLICELDVVDGGDVTEAIQGLDRS